MNKIILTLLAILLLASPVLGASEIIRPTGTFDESNRYQGNGNAYDNSLTTFVDMATFNDGRFFVGSTVDIATDAWDTPSDVYGSAIFYCVYASDGWDGSGENDTSGLEIRDGADALVVTLEAATNAAVTLSTYTWDLTSGYLADPTDLRCVAHFDRSGPAPTGNHRIYEVWIEGSFGRTHRMINH